MNRLLLLISLMVLATGCRSLYDRSDYVKSPVKGQISASDWLYVYAYTDAEAKKPDGIAHILVLTTRKPTNGCPSQDNTVTGHKELIIGIDGKVGEMTVGGKSGEYESSDEMFTYKKAQRKGTVAFFDASKQGTAQYQFATNGKIKITKITATTIEGFVLARINPDNYANGKFKAKLCKWGQLN